MASDNFLKGLVLRISIMIVIVFLLVLVVFKSYFFSAAVLFLCLSYSVINLYHFNKKPYKSIYHFLEIIKGKDFSTAIENPNENLVLSEINQGFRSIIDAFKAARLEKEKQHQFLQLIVDHVAIGLISFDEKGEIELINEAAKKILNVQYISNIHSLARIDENLPQKLISLQSGEQILFKLTFSNRISKILSKSAELNLENTRIKLISIQDISSELDAQEIAAWQTLIRVLTHEIMNSISPITSLSSTISLMLNKQIDSGSFDASSLNDVLLGLNTITRRGEGLLKFVESYRMLTQLPEPVYEEIQVADLLNNVSVLLSQELKNANIVCMLSVEPENLVLHADRKMIEQVMINLINNAKDALKNSYNPEIVIFANLLSNGNCLISIKDNGEGMEQELIDKAFVPFFTTKDKGTGIGLSLTRQIIQIHGGKINIKSAKGEGTTVTIEI